MRFQKIIWQNRLTLLLIATYTMAFSPVALAQTLAEAFAYREARNVVEVRVHARSKPGGRGWAVTSEERGIEYCFIVTPFHVIGDEFERTVYSDVVVEGAGFQLSLRANHIANDGKDLALLRLEQKGGCPFVNGPLAGQIASGLWLVRLSDTNVLEQIEGDARLRITPTGEDFGTASMTVATADRVNFQKGWSGATVIQDGRRIGMVFGLTDQGAKALFYTAQGIFLALRDKVRVLEPASYNNNRDGEPCSLASGDSNECRSGYCLPGPHPHPDGSGMYYCTNASMNCAFPGSRGAYYGDQLQNGSTMLTCKAPGGPFWGQFIGSN